MPGWLGPLLGAGASIFGSLLGASSSRSSNRAMLQNAALDRQFQMDLARNQIQWRVADAQAAGIHPIYALGPTGMSYNPPAVMQNDVGSYYANMGQDISRAIGALMSQREREQAARQAAIQQELARKREMEQDRREAILFDQQVRGNEIDMAYRKSQIARLNSPGTGPGYEVQNAPPGTVSTVPDRVTVGSVGAPERSPGVITDYSFGRTASGGYRVVPSEDMKQRIEDMPSEWQWFFSNGLAPHSSIYEELERRHPAGPGYEWDYDAFRGEFRRVRQGDAGRRLYRFIFRPDLHRR